MRYGMMIELDKCIGCQACVSSCKQRWQTGPKAHRDWVQEFESGDRETGLELTFYPGLCNHCAEHPCTTECPTNATYADENGVVVVDPRVCIGCGNCVSLCPYNARQIDERKKIVEKCNFCAPYVARGETPACVTTCLAECRHFGNLDDPTSDLSRLIITRQAEPLYNQEVRIGPKVYYAPAQKRSRLLEQKVIGQSRSSNLTKIWQDYTRPAARYFVPAAALLTGLAGLVLNLRHRATLVKKQESTPATQIVRHRLGMRLLHWFNALSWLLLLISGIALMVAPTFTLAGTRFSNALANLVGGQANLIYLHAAWGLFWAAIIVPFFIYFKRGGLEALQEVRLTLDDLKWLIHKPLVLTGLSKKHLPPQDKYNAGQKLFAIFALVGTTAIIATGVIMTFHLGTPTIIRMAILVHKLAIMLFLLGIAVHITMAAILVEERPALRSMLTGKIDEDYAVAHNSKWHAKKQNQGDKP